MPIRKILEYPDQRLLQKAKPIDDINHPDIQTLVDDMFATMYHEDGAGLAAPQIGADHRVIVIDLSRGRNEPYAKQDLFAVGKQL